MKNQPETNKAPPVATEPDDVWVSQRHEDLQAQAADFAAQFAELEQEYARFPALLKPLSRAFGFGAAGKLERARFKLDYKREQLAQFEYMYPNQ